MIAATGHSSLSFLLQGICTLPPECERQIAGITLDSRRAGAGSLFLACRGKSGDGRRFVADAIARGAVAVLEEVDAEAEPQVSADAVPRVAIPALSRWAALLAARFHGEPARAMRLVGVTGTNGKTTCTQLMAAHFQALGHCCAVIGTLGYGISGEPLQTLGEGPGTTPDAVRLQEILAELRARGADMAVMEVSSHGLDQYRVDVDDFVVAVFTNLSRDHLDYHGTLDAYAAAKRRLFTGHRLQLAALNLDDNWSATTRSQLAAGTPCLTWSLADPAADIVAEHIDYQADGLRLRVRTPWGTFSCSSPLLGGFNASNLLATLAVVLGCESVQPGFDAGAVVAALSGLQPVRGRMQLVSAAPLTVVVDYAHTPDALEKALQALRRHAPGKLVCVVGCGGERDRGKRPAMAAVAAALSDRLILTSDNPRGEAPQAIIDDMLSGLQPSQSVVVEPDRAVAIERAIMEAAAGDCILLAGKGHEQYQEVAGRRLPFDDVEQAQRALQGRARRAGVGA